MGDAPTQAAQLNMLAITPAEAKVKYAVVGQPPKRWEGWKGLGAMFEVQDPDLECALKFRRVGQPQERWVQFEGEG